MHVPPWYFPLQIRLYRLQEAIYSDIVQELAILYIACSDRYIHSKNGSGRWLMSDVRSVGHQARLQWCTTPVVNMLP